MTALPANRRDDGWHFRKEREMRLSDDILHLLETLQWPIVGFEGEGGSGKGTGSGNSSETEEEDDTSSDEDEDEEEDDSSKKGGKKEEDEEDDTAGLRSALKKERTARREAQKGLKKLQSEFEQFKTSLDKGKKEEEEAETKKQADAATAKLERLATGFARNAVDSAVVKALQSAKMPKFEQHDDVLRLIDRDDIDFEQDDDDPSKVTVNLDDVKQVIRDLAKAKPHLLIKSEEGEEGSGNSNNQGNKTGKFGGGSNSKTQTQSRREELAKKYPALGRR